MRRSFGGLFHCPGQAVSFNIPAFAGIAVVVGALVFAGAGHS